MRKLLNRLATRQHYQDTMDHLNYMSEDLLLYSNNPPKVRIISSSRQEMIDYINSPWKGVLQNLGTFEDKLKKCGGNKRNISFQSYLINKMKNNRGW